MELKIIYEDENIVVVEKPPGFAVFLENKTKEKTLIDELLKQFPSLKNVGSLPRRGIVHRLDKDTSGILLVAKNDRAYSFFQKQFKERKVIKKYLALVIGRVKETKGEIKTLIGRDPKNRKKQKAFLFNTPEAKKKGLREAETLYKVLERFEDFTLLEVQPKTGRKHQLRCHLAFIGHPIAGDKIYGFKNQPKPEGLKRQFLHATYLRIKLPNGKMKEFQSEMPDDLKRVLNKLKIFNF